jgi:hypothetical protein
MKIVGLVVLLAAVLFGGWWYNQHRALQAANNGDTNSPDNSVTTSLVPDATPTPAPAKPASMPGSTAVSTPSQSITATQTSLKADSDVPPASDTIARQPPNGMTFAGTGPVQVYRQGNITWRINTTDGSYCVLFATNREWRKPQVYNAGCRKS